MEYSRYRIQQNRGARGMKINPRHLVCLVVGLVFMVSCAIAGANPQVTIENKSGYQLYVYDTDGSNQNRTPATLTLPNGKTAKLMLQAGAGRKVFFASNTLNAMEQRGIEPDPFNPTNDGNVMFSFLEYTYTTSDNLYTVDMSYVDVFSYPVTLMFNQTYKDVCQAFHQYGFSSFSAVAAALQAQGDPWKNLVWQDPAKKMFRIVAPNKIWTFADTPPPNVPSNYRDFYSKLPPNGTQLFNPVTNFDGWKAFYQNDPDYPAHKVIMNTGYVKALLSKASPDKNGKHGFYMFPKDGRAEFTNLPASVQLTLTIHPYDK